MWWDANDSLSTTEAAQLAELEGRIDRGLSAFAEVGQALTIIRDARLYRASHTSFEAYCGARWDLSRSRAYQFIDAASVMQTVHNCLHMPRRESQVRPLVGLLPAEQRAIWERAVATAPGGTVTAAHVQATVDLHFGRTPKAPPAPSDDRFDAHMDAWSWDSGRMSVLGVEPRLPQPPPSRPEMTVVAVEIRLTAATEDELGAAIDDLSATNPHYGLDYIKAGRDGRWLAYGTLVVSVPAPPNPTMPTAGPAPAMGPLIRDLARALAACPQMRGGAIQIGVPFPKALNRAVDALGEAFAWHGHDDADLGRAGLIELCQTPFGDWPVPPAARDYLPLDATLLDDEQCPTATLTRLARPRAADDSGR